MKQASQSTGESVRKGGSRKAAVGTYPPLASKTFISSGGGRLGPNPSGSTAVNSVRGPHFTLAPVLAPALETTKEQYAVYLENYGVYVKFVASVRSERIEAKKEAVLERKAARKNTTSGTKGGEGVKTPEDLAAKAAARRAKKNARRKAMRQKRNAGKKSTEALIAEAERLSAMTKKVIAERKVKAAEDALKKAKSAKSPSRTKRQERRKEIFQKQKAASSVKSPETGAPTKPRGTASEQSATPLGRRAKVSARAAEKRPAKTVVSDVSGVNVRYYADPTGQPILPQYGVQTPFSKCPHGKLLSDPCSGCLRK